MDLRRHRAGDSGQDAWLTVGVTIRREGISTFNDGSILRDVKLMAVPQNHLVRFNIETTLDSNYRDAVLKVWTAMAFRQGAGDASTSRCRIPGEGP